jgi:hypothetical protein
MINVLVAKLLNTDFHSRINVFVPIIFTIIRQIRSSVLAATMLAILVIIVLRLLV